LKRFNSPRVKQENNQRTAVTSFSFAGYLASKPDTALLHDTCGRGCMLSIRHGFSFSWSYFPFAEQ
jgi:hypothetical protein